MDDSHLPSPTGIDTCHYTLHFPSLSPTELARTIPDVLAFVATLSSSYIWHKQPFNLALSPASSVGPAAGQYLEGRTDCTDCVDDEWFIVWLLREVSRVWETVVVSVEDEDGEFLLIEGADVLPRWVTPQNAANRVWIHQQRLHLVPLEHKSPLPFQSEGATNPSFEPEEEGFIDRSTAIALIRDSAVATLAPAELEDIVWARINGYPSKIASHHHRTLAYLPTDIALALSDSPSLVAEAIAAFYEREPTTLRACNSMTRFPPARISTAFSPELLDAVMIPTTLTRPLYSQLVLQRFFAPKPFDKVNWMDGANGQEEERRRSVGMKIACGFEMLYKLSSPQLRVDNSFDPEDPLYRAFMARLAGNGYFENEIEGSALWTSREKTAREGWLAARVDRSSISFAQRVDEAIARARSCPLDRILSPLSSAAALALEDGQEWLSLDEMGFEEMLKGRGPGKGGLGDLDDEELDTSESEGEGMEGVEGEGEEERKEERKAKRAARKLEGMASKVEEFVQGRGAVDGAEFSDEQSSDEEEEEPLSPEERVKRTAALVAPLPDVEWGQKEPSPPPASSEPLAPPPTVPLPPRAPKLTSNKYDGASSDESSEDEVEGEEGLGGAGEGEEEDGPSVVQEVDMGEEMDEFLKFATETLGLSEEQYGKILGERKSRGAFVPGPAKAKKTNVVPSATKQAPKAVAPPVPKPTVPQPPLRNPNLTDFDALMEQMDVELAKTRAPGASKPTPDFKPTFAKPSAKPTPSSSKSKPNPRAPADKIIVDSDSEPDSEDEDMGSMDAELAELFKNAGGAEEGGTMDYNLVKNFLESFQSQGGFGGPAGNMAGRMGFQLPRDETR